MWSKKMTSRFEIRIFLYGRLAYVYQFDDYAEARKTYLRETGHFEQYTQLVVEGEIYNTAKAEKFFGPRSTQEKWELLRPLSRKERKANSYDESRKNPVFTPVSKHIAKDGDFAK